MVAGSEKEQKVKTNLRRGSRQAESFKQDLLNSPVGVGETFLETFLFDYVIKFSVPVFVAFSGSLGAKVPIGDDVMSSDKREVLFYYFIG